MARDVSKRRQLEDALRDSEQRYRDLFEEAPLAYFSVGPDGRIRRANRRAGELLGYRPDQLTGRPVLDLYADTPGGKARAQKLFGRFLAGDVLEDEELEMQRADGTPVWVGLTVRPVRDTAGQIVESRSMIVDITDRKRAMDAMEHMALHDPLTNLPNRRHFSERLTQALEQAGPREKGAAVLFLDLDDFKVVTDTLGHTMGDQLLQAVAKRLAGCVRQTETVARQGGDEFMLVVPDIEGQSDASKVAQRILDVLREPFHLEGHEFHVTPSIGVVLAGPGDDAEALLKKADVAMYRVKGTGKDGYQFFDDHP